ncbi:MULTISPECIES: hypothetical protein [Pseudomonas syringae group]|uniref:Knr4/Smi1-like domain-containing protein n=2 Tax=Pseudomonas syringae group TaxID=136849 RepID=A0A2K4WI24_9PSED|nr:MULTISPECIES: hypothetical protein [Pseudomonas syringae group]POC81520.1 hypothetical protein BKM26_28935 [Pseudomonas avellanae]POD12714.1 hypothetical protein BKM05_27760 [Pseudomonas avellanae]SOS35557.1 hypothetical protein CFBP6411_04200 [Pseudomonas syringae group genomosp. 3]
MNEEILKKFAKRFNESEQSSGKISFRDAPKKLATDSLPFTLSGEVEEFYAHLEMEDDPTIGGDLFFQIFMIDQLEQAQDGWSGPDDESLPWLQSFVVFADRSGDALVFDSAQENPSIYGSIQNRSFLIADSMGVFLEALLIAIEIEEDKFDGDTREDDMSFKEDFIDCVQTMISGAASKLDTNGFMKFFFG